MSATWGSIQDCQTPRSGVLTLQDLKSPLLAFQATCSGPPWPRSMRGRGPPSLPPCHVLPECCCPTVWIQGSPGRGRSGHGSDGVQSGVTPRGHRRLLLLCRDPAALPQNPRLHPCPTTRDEAPTPPSLGRGCGSRLSGQRVSGKPREPSPAPAPILPGAAEAGDTCVPR